MAEQDKKEQQNGRHSKREAGHLPLEAPTMNRVRKFRSILLTGNTLDEKVKSNGQD
jgi:hypothetical protein